MYQHIFLGNLDRKAAWRMLVLAEGLRSTYAMMQVRGRYIAGTSDTARPILRSVTA